MNSVRCILVNFSFQDFCVTVWNWCDDPLQMAYNCKIRCLYSRERSLLLKDFALNPFLLLILEKAFSALVFLQH